MTPMPIPAGLRAVDLMLQIPSDDFRSKYEFLKPLLLDRESREQFEFPAQYMFKDIPTTRRSDDYVGIALDEMDRHGVERAMIGVGIGDSDARRALKEHPDRFFGSFEVNPNLGMEAVRERVFQDMGRGSARWRLTWVLPIHLMIVGLLAAILIVSHLVMGLLILQGQASMRTAHQHSGYLTVAVVGIGGDAECESCLVFFFGAEECV